MTFEDMVALLNKALGLELLVEDGACGFAADDDDGGTVNILLSDAKTLGAVLLFAELGELPPADREGLCRALLKANSLFAGTGGATLGLNPATGQVSLQRCEEADALANDAERRVTAFVETALAWKRLIADYRANDAEKAAEAPAVPPPEGEFGSFLQV